MTKEQLLQLRTSRGLTREELAIELGDCSASAIVKWERGEREIPAWVEKQMFSNVELKLPLADLSAMLDYARDKNTTFEQLLIEAIRDRIKPTNVAPFKLTRVISSEADLLKVAEDAPASSSTAPPPAPGSSGGKSTRDRIAESLVSDAESKKAGAGSGGRKPRQ